LQSARHDRVVAAAKPESKSPAAALQVSPLDSYHGSMMIDVRQFAARPWCRLHLSTWLLLIPAVVVILLVEIPGDEPAGLIFEGSEMDTAFRSHTCGGAGTIGFTRPSKFNSRRWILGGWLAARWRSRSKRHNPLEESAEAMGR
jgi:hypothetical protein